MRFFVALLLTYYLNLLKILALERASRAWNQLIEKNDVRKSADEYNATR